MKKQQSSKTKSIKNIIKSRINDKSKLGQWYKDRLAICEICPNNTKNKKELSNSERIAITLNSGDNVCSLCFCGVTFKSSIPEEQCPDLPPRWESIKMEYEMADFDLKLVRMAKPVAIYKENNEVVIDYNTLKRGVNSEVVLSIKETSHKINNPTVSSSCGCTTPAIETKENEHILKIKYNTNLVGTFKKTVIFSYTTEDNKNKNQTFKIRGTVL